jgi:hypothetical protein
MGRVTARFLSVTDAEVVTKDAACAANDGTGKRIAAKRIGDKRATGGTGHPTFGIIVKTTGKGRDAKQRCEIFDFGHSTRPPEGLVMPANLPLF